MYVWMLLSNNAIVLYWLVKYLWLIKKAMVMHRFLATKSFTMKMATNLFLYLLPDYTLANFFLLSAPDSFIIYSPFIKKIKADGVIQQAGCCYQV